MMRRSQNGLTLAELLTACALLAVLLGLALPAVSRWIGRQQLQGALDDVAAALSLARKTAISAQRPVWVTASEQPDQSWRIRVSYLRNHSDCLPERDVRCLSGGEHAGTRLRLNGSPGELQFSPLHGLPYDADGRLLKGLEWRLERDGCQPAELRLLPTGLIHAAEAACP